jgi:hypothetical protein
MDERKMLLVLVIIIFSFSILIPVSVADHNVKCSANFFSIGNSNDAWDETNTDCGFFEKNSRWMYRLINDSNDLEIGKNNYIGDEDIEIRRVNDTVRSLNYSDNDTTILTDDTVGNSLHIPDAINSTFENNREGEGFSYISLGDNPYIHNIDNSRGLANKEFMEEFWIQLYNQDGETIRESVDIEDISVDNWDSKDFNTSNPNRLNLIRDWSWREHPWRIRYESSTRKVTPRWQSGEDLVTRYNNIVWNKVLKQPDSGSASRDESLVPSLRGEGEMGYVKNNDVVDIDAGDTRSIEQAYTNAPDKYEYDSLFRDPLKEKDTLIGQSYTAIYSIDPSTRLYPTRRKSSAFPDDDSVIIGSNYKSSIGQDVNNDYNNKEIVLVGEENTNIKVLSEESLKVDTNYGWDEPGARCPDQYDMDKNIDEFVREHKLFVNGDKIEEVDSTDPELGKTQFNIDMIDHISTSPGLNEAEVKVETDKSLKVSWQLTITRRYYAGEEEGCETSGTDYQSGEYEIGVENSDTRRVFVEELGEPDYYVGRYTSNNTTQASFDIGHGMWNKIQKDNGKRMLYNIWRITTARDARWDLWESRQSVGPDVGIEIFEGDEVKEQLLLESDVSGRPQEGDLVKVALHVGYNSIGGEPESVTYTREDEYTLDDSSNPGQVNAIAEVTDTVYYDCPTIDDGCYFEVEIEEFLTEKTPASDGHLPEYDELIRREVYGEFCAGDCPFDQGEGHNWDYAVGRNLREVSNTSKVHDAFPLVTRAFPSYANDSQKNTSRKYNVTMSRHHTGKIVDETIWRKEILSPNMSVPMLDCEPIPKTVLRDPSTWVDSNDYIQDCNFVFEVRKTKGGVGFLDLYNAYSIPSGVTVKSGTEINNPEVHGLVNGNKKDFLIQPNKNISILPTDVDGTILNKSSGIYLRVNINRSDNDNPIGLREIKGKKDRLEVTAVSPEGDPGSISTTSYGIKSNHKLWIDGPRGNSFEIEITDWIQDNNASSLRLQYKPVDWSYIAYDSDLIGPAYSADSTVIDAGNTRLIFIVARFLLNLISIGLIIILPLLIFFETKGSTFFKQRSGKWLKYMFIIIILLYIVKTLLL